MRKTPRYVRIIGTNIAARLVTWRGSSCYIRWAGYTMTGVLDYSIAPAVFVPTGKHRHLFAGYRI